MSIIHDALKKLQQGSLPKADDKSAAPAAATPGSPDYIYSPPPPEGQAPAATPFQEDPKPAVPPKPPAENKTKSMLALLCALVITAGIFVFLFHQINKYFPRVASWTKSSISKLFHIKEKPGIRPKAKGDLGPLAKITVNTPSPANPSASGVFNQESHVTLNIHGVMANGPKNAVLINDDVYQEGDSVEGVKILKINLDAITVLNNGQQETIRVTR